MFFINTFNIPDTSSIPSDATISIVICVSSSTALAVRLSRPSVSVIAIKLGCEEVIDSEIGSLSASLTVISTVLVSSSLSSNDVLKLKVGTLFLGGSITGDGGGIVSVALSPPPPHALSRSKNTLNDMPLNNCFISL
ncbi:hypothetical protein PPAR_a3537 [Pseudoalteromonas paragorgicola KMM 3548]|nr:hypothetical protein [Pseudoalteromonas distincta KMM 3548]